MKKKMIQILCIFTVAACLFTEKVMAQDTVYRGTDTVSDRAVSVYKEALGNMNMPNANYVVHLSLNTSIGNFTVADDIKCQKSPLLAKSVLTGQSTINTGKQPQPIFNITQYMQLTNNEEQIYYMFKDDNKKKQQWYVQKQQLDPELKKLLGATDFDYAQQMRDTINAVDTINIDKETDNGQILRVKFNNKKLFDSNKVLKDSNAVFSGIPTADRANTIKMVRDILDSLGNSRDIVSTILIDKTTHRIASVDLDITEQLKAVMKAVFSSALGSKIQSAPIAALPTRQPENSIGVGNGAAEINGIVGSPSVDDFINSLQAHLTITIEPLDDVMQLAVPQEVRDTAIEVKPEKLVNQPTGQGI
ncbi:hypothetical protein [Pectinatus frisingensis]|uniref:hypothetical protein n=1 Tax=Pectinatus frisingensis TaxID=865 RepID=UPI0018C4ED43|nr:hypothetical protein [Pectinatus frisingensis]